MYGARSRNERLREEAASIKTTSIYKTIHVASGGRGEDMLVVPCTDFGSRISKQITPSERGIEGSRYRGI